MKSNPENLRRYSLIQNLKRKWLSIFVLLAQRTALLFSKPKHKWQYRIFGVCMYIQIGFKMLKRVFFCFFLDSFATLKESINFRQVKTLLHGYHDDRLYVVNNECLNILSNKIIFKYDDRSKKWSIFLQVNHPFFRPMWKKDFGKTQNNFIDTSIYVMVVKALFWKIHQKKSNSQFWSQ